MCIYMYTFTWIPVRPSRVESVRTGGVLPSPSLPDFYSISTSVYGITYARIFHGIRISNFCGEWIGFIRIFLRVSGIDLVIRNWDVIFSYLKNGKSRGIYLKKVYIYICIRRRRFARFNFINDTCPDKFLI